MWVPSADVDGQPAGCLSASKSRCIRMASDATGGNPAMRAGGLPSGQRGSWKVRLPSGRPPLRTPSTGQLWPMLAVGATAMLLLIPTTVAYPNVSKIWVAPYSGRAFHSGTTNQAGCDTASGLETFNPTTGSVTGPSLMTAKSCTSSSSTSFAIQSAEAWLALNHFSGIGGKHVATVNWSVSFVMKLNITGTGCSVATANGKVYLEAGWANLSGSRTSQLGGALAGISHSITGPASKTWKVSPKIHVAWTMNMSASASYTI